MNTHCTRNQLVHLAEHRRRPPLRLGRTTRGQRLQDPFVSGQQSQVPDKIIARIDAIKDSDRWENAVAREDFHRWVLAYHIGTTTPQEGVEPPITDVSLEAAFRS